MKKQNKKCMFWKGGKCISDYAKGIRCGGYAIISKDCPYNKKEQEGNEKTKKSPKI